MRNDKEIAKRLYVSGMKLADIAEKLGILYGTVKNWSASEKWSEIRVREDSLNDRLIKMIDEQVSEMEGSRLKKDDVIILEKMMTMRNANRVGFIDKVKMMKELTEYAISAATHADSQAVAEITRQYIETEYEKLEE